MPANEVRIIGGLWKGRKLRWHGNAAVRPTLGRARETLFNWLAGQVAGSNCLDLFAGSGALGFEALSRGAHSVVFVDNSRDAVGALRDNARRLGTENGIIRRQSAHAFLKDAEEQGTPTLGQADATRETPAIHQWDIVFLDPPYASHLLATTLRALQTGNLLSEEARVYYELERRDAIDLEGWTVLKRGLAGDTQFGLLASSERHRYHRRLS